jgi:hypothetical protein
VKLLPRFTPAQGVAGLFGQALVYDPELDAFFCEWLGPFPERWLQIQTTALLSGRADPLYILGALIKHHLLQRYGPEVFTPLPH